MWRALVICMPGVIFACLCVCSVEAFCEGREAGALLMNGHVLDQMILLLSVPRHYGNVLRLSTKLST